MQPFAKHRRAIIVAIPLLIVGLYLIIWPPARYGGRFLNNNYFTLQAGKELGERHCGGCHATATPEILDRDSWNYVLSYMGLFLGVIDKPRGDLRSLGHWQRRKEFLNYLDATPDKASISNEDWQRLRNYYLYYGADPQPIDGPAATNLFQVDTLFAAASDPAISLLKFDTDSQSLFVGYGWEKKLAQINWQGKIVRIINVDSAPVSMVPDEGSGYYLALIGDLLGNSPGRRPGRIERLKNGRTQLLLRNLYRTANLAVGDVDNDGSDDLLVSQFGIAPQGRLSWFQRQRGVWKEQTLVGESGSVKSMVLDFDGDGQADVLSLVADAHERLLWHRNEGSGEFTRTTLLEKHPSWGFTYFETGDFDGDKKPDLLLVNGDNADAGPYNPRKPYHGARIYRNKGDGTLELMFFQPLQGAYLARSADFNKDGRLDFVVASYFPDLAQPTRMLYVENKGENVFAAQAIANMPRTRITVIDTADVDNDGDIDVAIGTSDLAYKQKEGERIIDSKLDEDVPSVLLLRNQSN